MNAPTGGRDPSGKVTLIEGWKLIRALAISVLSQVGFYEARITIIGGGIRIAAWIQGVGLPFVGRFALIFGGAISPALIAGQRVLTLPGGQPQTAAVLDDIANAVSRIVRKIDILPDEKQKQKKKKKCDDGQDPVNMVITSTKLTAEGLISLREYVALSNIWLAANGPVVVQNTYNNGKAQLAKNARLVRIWIAGAKPRPSSR